jgi:hypothetical protein
VKAEAVIPAQDEMTHGPLCGGCFYTTFTIAGAPSSNWLPYIRFIKPLKNAIYKILALHPANLTETKWARTSAKNLSIGGHNRTVRGLSNAMEIMKAFLYLDRGLADAVISDFYVAVCFFAKSINFLAQHKI